MFPREVIESFVYIAVISAAIVWYGVALGRRDRDAGPSADIFKHHQAIGEVDSDSHKKTA